MQIDLSVNFFLSINNKNITHSREFRVSNCTFRKVQGVDLQMTQSSRAIVHIVWVKCIFAKVQGVDLHIFKV